MNRHSLPAILLTVGFIFGRTKCSSFQRIAGGSNAESGEFPYMVSIQSQNHHWCGGAIISERHILSAAHCFIFRSGNAFYDEKTHGPLMVKAGTNDLMANPSSYVYTEVEELIVSSYYENSDARYYIFDFSILKLRTKLNLVSDYPKLRKIDLPAFDAGISYDGEYATISGFGKTNNPGTLDFYQPTMLSKLSLQIWNNDYCTYLFSDRVLDRSHVCAYAPRNTNQLRGTCPGDSGSPLVYNNTVIGILSSSATLCGEANNPSVFTKVSSWVPFIRYAIEGRYTNDMAIKRF